MAYSSVPHHGRRSHREHRGAALVITLALLPQIVKNFQLRSGGGWSPISAGLSAGGNAARVFTTLKLAGGNPLLLAQYGCGLVLNGVLLAQSLFWPSSSTQAEAEVE